MPCFGGLWTTWGICLIDYEVAKLSGVICAMVNRVDEDSLLWRFHISNRVLRLIIFIILFWAQPLRDRGKFGSDTTGFYGLSVYCYSYISGMEKTTTAS